MEATAFIILLQLLSFPLFINGEPISNDLARKIDEYLNQTCEEAVIPSLTFALTSKNGTYTKGYGWRNYDKNLTSDEDTLFAIGSVTKNMASLLISWELNKLFPELGESVLDTPIKQLAPNYGLVLRDKFRTEQVTFRDLLSHRVCTHRNDLPWVVGVYDNVTDMLYRERYADEVCSFRDGVRLGLDEKYNNRMYSLAWDVLESLTGKTFEKATTDFFALVGMTRSTIIKSTDDDDYDKQNRAMPHAFLMGEDGYELHAESPEKMKTVEPLAAAGAILSSAKDMLAFLQLQLNKGKVNGTQVIPAEVFLWPRTPSHLMTLGELKNEPDSVPWIQYAYRLGFWHEDYDGWLRIGHTGGIASFITYMYFYPELDLGVFFSINAIGRYVDLLGIQNRIYEIIQKPNEPPSSSVRPVLSEIVDFSPFIQAQKNSRKMQENKPKANYSIPDEKLPGNYGNAMFGIVKIVSETSGNNVSFNLEWGKYARATLKRDGLGSFSFIDNQLYYGSSLFQDATFEFLNETHISAEGFDFAIASHILVRDFDLASLPDIPWEEDKTEPCPSSALDLPPGVAFKLLSLVIAVLVQNN